MSNDAAEANRPKGSRPKGSRPEGMRAAMAEFVAAAHQAYLSQARLLAPAERARLPLLAAGSFTVVAAGAGNLHVLATTEALPPPRGQEVELTAQLNELTWTLRFYDPVVLPALGLVNERAAPQPDAVRRVLGIGTVLYHLVVQPGSQLDDHHAVHLGTGLANAHATRSRELDVVRAHTRGRDALVDELAGALIAGLPRAAALLASAIAPGDQTLAGWAAAAKTPDSDEVPADAAVLTTLVAAVRGR